MGPVPRVVMACAVLLWWGAPARAQLTASPESLRVVLLQGQEAVRSVTLSNGGAAAAAFCLDVLSPGQQHHAPGSLGAGCGPPGELLATYTGAGAGSGWFPYGLTMTPDGRLFVANFGSGIPRTFELTADLAFVRAFPHPTVTEYDPFPFTGGVTFHEDTGRLWWTNQEHWDTPGVPVRRVLLLEGTTVGGATGRRVELPVPPGPPPGNTGRPIGAAYEVDSGRFYYLDAANDDLWAADTTGAVLPGYPVTLEAYPDAYLGNGVGVHGGSDDLRLEIPVGLVQDLDYDRIVVTDGEGRDLGLETPIPPPLTGSAGVVFGVARSRLDPNGVLYGTYQTGGPNGVAAIRPVPLSPSWLTLGAWMGDVAGASSVEVSLTFRAGEREPGEYRAMLVVEDTTGTVLASVPLVMEVTPDTPAEPDPAGTGSTLWVVPNPARSAAVAMLSMSAPGRVLLAAYDVLGREMDVIADGRLPAGRHEFAIDLKRLPAGVYLLRAVVDAAGAETHMLVERFTLTR